MFTRLRNMFKKVPKKISVSIAVVSVIAAVAIPAMVMAGYGPDRPTFDWNKFDPSKSCTDPSQAGGRCGSMDGPVFNSFINNPAYGDERNFTRIATATPGSAPNTVSYTETANVTPGQEYWVRTYVHNDANQNLNGANFDGPSVARDTKVRVAIAQGASNAVDVMTYVTAQNAKPTKIWDTATLANGSQAFSVSYVPGSATLYNGVHQNGTPLPDAITSADGTPVGYNQMDGNLPGCFDYSAFVYVKVKVQAPALQVDKTVRVSGTTKYEDKITAKKTDNIQWRIKYTNSGTADIRDLTIRDTLPAGVTLIPGTIKWTTASHNAETLQDSALTKGGINLGNYAPAGAGNISGYVTFETSINKDFKECTLHNVAYGRATDVPETDDDSTVTIDNCTPVVPIYTCDVLEATSLGNRKFSYTVKYTAKNATLKQVSYNFGDATTPMLTDKTTVEHTYAVDGTYTTKATLTFTVDGVDKTVTSEACASTVNSNTPKDNCTIPGKENLPKNSPECVVTPTVLPNTGPGDVAAVFAAVTVAGIAAYQVFVTRRIES